ncbi:hypothetical protein MKW98_029900, partial [Papaver atlanticum]
DIIYKPSRKALDPNSPDFDQKLNKLIESVINPFYLQLEGVALGIKLAKKYNPFPFYLYCQSASVCEFVMQNWKRKYMCICSGNWETVTIRCKACSKRFMFTQDQKDHEQAFELTKDIFSDISILESRGLGWFVVCTSDRERNEAAYHVANLRQTKELKLREIVDSPELWDILNTEVFGHYFE